MEDPSFPWDHNTRPDHGAGLIQKPMPLAQPNPDFVSYPRRSVLSNLSLDVYIDMHSALTKGSSPKVQKVSAVERAMYKMNDLKQVLLMHGLSAGSKNKQDLLDAMEGLILATPAVHLDNNILGNQQCTTHNQYVQLEVTAADLALLGWMKPEKASTAEAALGRPKHLSGLCNKCLAEGMTGPDWQRQEALPILKETLAGQAPEVPGKDALTTAVFDLPAACAPDARAQMVCTGAGPSASIQTDERHEQLPLTPGQEGCTRFAASPDSNMDRHQMTTCSSQAAAAIQHITSGAPVSQASHHVCETAQHQLLVRTMCRDDESTLISAAATDNSQLISRPPLPANALLPEEPPGSTRTAQTPRTSNTIQNAAGTEACDPSQKRGADDQVDERAKAATLEATHDARYGPEGCPIGSASVPWRTKRKAACLKPAATGLHPGQPESPNKRRWDPHFAAPPSCHASENRTEEVPRSDPQGTAPPTQANLQKDCSSGAIVQTHALGAAKCSQDLLKLAGKSEEPARGLCVGSLEHLQPAAEHTAKRIDSAPIALEEFGAAASSTGYCPTWLAEQVLQLAQKSVAAPLPKVSKPGCLIGRSIGFVLLEDFDAGGDTVMRGIKTGRVLEYISDDHMEEVCSRTCVQQHSYHYVRLNKGGLTKQPGVGTKKQCLRVDFKLDLHPSLHQKSLAGLLLLNSTALQDAWMLLEPVVSPF